MKFNSLFMVLLMMVFVSGCINQQKIEDKETQAKEDQTNVLLKNKTINTPEEIILASAWKYGGLAIPGKYADAEIIDIENDTPRPKGRGIHSMKTKLKV